MRNLAIYVAVLMSPVLLLGVFVFTAPTAAKAPIFLWQSPYLGEMTMPEAECRHEALFCAFVASERYTVRIAYGWPSGEQGLGDAHVQAQARVGEGWAWLTMVDRECQFGNQDIRKNKHGEDVPFFIEQYFTLEYYVDQMFLWAENTRVRWMIEQEEGKK